MHIPKSIDEFVNIFTNSVSLEVIHDEIDCSQKLSQLPCSVTTIMLKTWTTLRSTALMIRSIFLSFLVNSLILQNRYDEINMKNKLKRTDENNWERVFEPCALECFQNNVSRMIFPEWYFLRPAVCQIQKMLILWCFHRPVCSFYPYPFWVNKTGN